MSITPGGGTVFVYGTLMADEVLKLLLKRVPPSRPATLAGHERHAIRGQVRQRPQRSRRSRFDAL